MFRAKAFRSALSQFFEEIREAAVVVSGKGSVLFAMEERSFVKRVLDIEGNQGLYVSEPSRWTDRTWKDESSCLIWRKVQTLTALSITGSE